MSIVFYKFKSAKDFDTCTFDGTGISVFDLKREIMAAKKLGKGTLDFDLVLNNAQTNEEYLDDQYMIQRNTSVLVSRKPSSKPGKGTAQRYVGAVAGALAPTAKSINQSNLMAQHALNPSGLPAKQYPPNNRFNASNQSASNRFNPAHSSTVSDPPATVNEEDAIKQMFVQQNEQWKQNQDRIALNPMYVRPMRGRGRGMPGGYVQQPYTSRIPPPEGYICYRCGEKGHYINECPTMGDKNYDNRPRLKRTTGIPKTFLKTVEKKDNMDSNVMLTQTGELVEVATNDDDWQRMHSLRKTYLGIGDVYEMAPILPEFECKLCTKLLREAVTAPCCNSNFCDECMTYLYIFPFSVYKQLAVLLIRPLLFFSVLYHNSDVFLNIIVCNKYASVKLEIIVRTIV